VLAISAHTLVGTHPVLSADCTIHYACVRAEFVQGGGSYLGLCAGAYYGCARVVFEPGTPLEVVGDRELAFFPGIARGAAFPGLVQRLQLAQLTAIWAVRH
jgi:glutamine amidotransferase-like uncharacterized protein